MSPTGFAAIHVEPSLPRDAAAAFLGLPPSPGAVALAIAASALVAVRLARLASRAEEARTDSAAPHPQA